MLKKLKEIGYTLAIYVTVMTIPYVYWAIFNSFNTDIPNGRTMFTGLLMLCHGLTLRKLYNVYVDKYSDEYHDK